MSLALDVSNYGTVPTPMQLDCLKSSGYTRAIVGCSDGTLANMQLAAYYASGMEVEAYCWVSYGSLWTSKIDHALNVLKTARGVTRMWLDVESDIAISGIDPTVSQLEARLQAVITYIQLARPDLELGIYTSWGFWTGHGNLTTFCAMPLDTAEYVADATTPPTGGPRLYGGWTKAEMWQYAGTIDTCGLSVDRSVILEGDESMKPMMVWDSDRQRAYLVGPFGAAWITKAADVTTLEGIYGKTAVALSAHAIDAIAMGWRVP